MEIQVRLFATFRETLGKEKSLSLPEGATGVDAMGALGLSVSQVAILYKNGRAYPPDSPLKDGDVLSLFPPVGGG